MADLDRDRMAQSYRVLIVEDEEEQAEMFKEFLQLSGPFVTEWAPSLGQLWKSLAVSRPDLMLLDYKLSDGYGLQALEELQKRKVKVPVIMITGQGDERLAVKAMQLGASDYMVKGGVDLLRLPSIIQKAIREFNLQQSVERTMEQIRYQALLLNNVRDAVVVWNTERKITYINLAAEGLYGFRSKECIGSASEAYLNAFTPPVKEPPREGTAGLEIERGFKDRQGKNIWVSSRVSALRDYTHNSPIIGFMDVTRDITSRKQMEAQFSTAQARLAKSSRLAAIGELASGVAHHINNPLTTIIAETQMLMAHLPEEHPGRESALAIEKAGWRVQRTVQRLIDYSEPVTHTLKDVPLNTTIQTAVEWVVEMNPSNSIQVQLQLNENLPTLRGYSSQLADLWMNLLLYAQVSISNGQPHTIRFTSRLVSVGLILVEMAYDGALIPANELSTIFDVDMTKPNRHGTGMELNICQEIVRQHKGRIAVQSDPQCGTVFSVYFPLEV
jgi:PAS domain S-box-containing protein